MKKIIYILFCFLTFNGLSQNIDYNTLYHDGIIREYIIFTPSNFQSNLPLVINLHGYTSTAYDQMIYSGMNQTAENNNFIVVYPQGTQDWSGNYFWNSDWDWAGSVDDVDFIDNLISEISNLYQIDLNNVFACGMSNGGFMSYKLGCDLSNKIKGICSVTGAMQNETYNNCTPIGEMPVLSIHGNFDNIISIFGSGWHQSVNSTINFWAQHNNAIYSGSHYIDNVSWDGTYSMLYKFKNSNNVKVFNMVVFGGGHTWPGTSSYSTLTSYDFSASNVIWKFFRQHINGNFKDDFFENIGESLIYSIYPNPVSQFFELEPKIEKDHNIYVYDVSGVLIKEFKNQPTQKKYIINDIQDGIYFIIIKKNGEIIAQEKIVIQK